VIVAASIVHRIFYWGGWSALVAIGTLGLAAVTYTLVRATKILAQRAEADVRAQWTPIVLVRDRVETDLVNLISGVTSSTLEPGIMFGEGTLRIFVENVGRGPAFDVQAYLNDFDLPGPGYGVPVGTPALPGAMSTRIYTTIAPGEQRAFEWSSLGDNRGLYSARFAYGGMAGSRLETHFEVSVGDDSQMLRWQRVEEEPLPPGQAWWQRVFPARLVGPLSRRRFERLYGPHWPEE
jgi:hypothetical protein